MVRPLQGRYLAGVCAAIARATGTDPVLWRVLLAVLGFFGGIGLLVYLAAWLLIPNEGDTASPAESLLGRGRSSMSPGLVIVLGVLVAVLFSFIVSDHFRAILLGVAVLIGGALLVNRQINQQVPPGGRSPGGAPGTGWPPAGTPSTPAAGAWPPPTTGTATPGPGPYPPPSGPVPPTPPWSGPWTPRPGAGPVPLVPPLPPIGGYRPPFAPHGPFAQGPYPHAPAHRMTAATAHRGVPLPNPPRERSPLGAATFSLIFVVIGVVALVDLAGTLSVPPSAYFAAALATIGLGLLVGTWFGRARWLIALGLVTALALGIASGTESFDHKRGTGDVTWTPANHAELADRYETTFGKGVLDLRQVDFTGQAAEVRAEVSFGSLRVLVPENVDVTVTTEVNFGDANILGVHSSGIVRPSRETDTGRDGPGGGELLLKLHVNFGDAEVAR